MALFDKNRILALDVGASKVVLAEYRVVSGVPELVNYGIEQLGVRPDEETDSSAYIVSAIRDIMRNCGIKPGPVLITISGQAVFPRYVKLPPVKRDKIMQIVNYEAEQNVPFPINEVVWDYQLISGDQGDELNVMLVAVKTDRVTTLTDCVIAAGLDPEIVDVAPMAIYNTVRYSHPHLEGCTMVLDVGARSSNVIFVEENRIFSRSIPVAGNTITQAVMKEFDVSFAEAEELKLEHAFVAFGGVYAGPEDDIADRISKIVRTVVARLHAEVNRSINFYRSQHSGSSPNVVLLTGGSSTIPHMDTFFREKLKVQVDYLNPFENITVSESIDGEAISRDAFFMGEVTGLALRKALVCPVEINLMPLHIVKKKIFKKRQPYFGVAAIALVLIMLCWWGYFHRMSASLVQQTAATKKIVTELSGLSRSLNKVMKSKGNEEERVGRVVSFVSQRTSWLHILDEIHGSMLDGMWLVSFSPKEEGGVVKYIEIRGKGFTDEVKDGSAVEALRDRLIASPYFTAKTGIKRLPGVRPGDYILEFTMWVYLEAPVAAK
ncbi:MAG: type IV pilus assembly protein PilM [Kiritimatiellae bacterium]|nr:type IV pilus assembly protein PilM [Kiritimatiellia bacterium]